MNLRLVSKLLGIISMLIGGTMLFSLPWAFPAVGRRNHLDVVHAHGFEQAGFTALFVSMAICFALAGMLIRWGRRCLPFVSQRSNGRRRTQLGFGYGLGRDAVLP